MKHVHDKIREKEKNGLWERNKKGRNAVRFGFLPYNRSEAEKLLGMTCGPEPDSLALKEAVAYVEYCK